MVACITSNGYLRLLQYSVGEGILVEDQHKPASSGVTAACLLKKTGHIAIVSPNLVTFFDPLLLEVAATMEIPMPPDGARNSKLQACPSGKLLILGRTDGVILRIPTRAQQIDLTLLVRSGLGRGRHTRQRQWRKRRVASYARVWYAQPRSAVHRRHGAASGWAPVASRVVSSAASSPSSTAATSGRYTAEYGRHVVDAPEGAAAGGEHCERLVGPVDSERLSDRYPPLRHRITEVDADSDVERDGVQSGIIPFSKSTRALIRSSPLGPWAVSCWDGRRHLCGWDSMSMDISTSQSSGKLGAPSLRAIGSRLYSLPRWRSPPRTPSRSPKVLRALNGRGPH